MKSVKIAGIENKVTRILRDARIAEMRAAGKFRLLSAVAVCIGMTVPEHQYLATSSLTY